MWIILLDASGSMADPFEGTDAFAGRQRTTLAQTKIEAAREALIIHLQGLGQSTQAAIFAFRSSPELVYDGSAADTARIKTVLDRIEANSGTDVAAALVAARDHVDSHPNQPVVRVLLISDGLSDPEAAEAASRELLSRRVPVDIILIASTEKGNELARRVAGQFGSVAAVTSASEIAAAVGDAGTTVRAEAAAVEHAEANLAAGFSKLRSASPGEELSFTAVHPSELAKNSWGFLLLFIHLASLTEEARARALGLGQAKRSDMLTPSVRASTRLPRGTKMTLTPHLAGFQVNPPTTELSWEEDIQETQFSIKPIQAPEGPVLGEIEISVMGLPIGRVPLSIQVRSAKDPRPGDQEPKLTPGGLFATIFASHARTDATVVRACKAVYGSLGIYLVIDQGDLISGQVWRPGIQALLNKSDACQLFWSAAASVSPEVKEEILDALIIQGDRGTGFIRPVYWVQPPPPLPPELKHLDFAYLDIERLQGISTGNGAAAPQRPDRDTPLRGAPDIPVAVLPLLPNTPAGSLQEIRQDVAFAITFVEQTVGSRYYPVPTLLVDHHTVRAVRAVETLDYGKFEPDRQQALADWGHLLGSICLSFHVHAFWEDQPREAAAGTAKRIGLEETAFDELVRYCEGGPSSWFVPSWLRNSNEKIPALANALTLQEAVAAVMTTALNATQAPDSQLRINIYNLDESWRVWRDELERLGLVCARRSFDCELLGTAASFRAGLDFLRPHIQPSVDKIGGRFAQRESLDQRLPATLGIADAICAGLFKDRFFSMGGLQSFVLDEIDPSRGWTEARAALAGAKFPGISVEQAFPEFANVFFDAVSQVLRQRIREIGDAHVKDGFSVPPAAWERLAASGIAGDLRGERDADGNVLMEGSISNFINVLEAAWKQAADLLSHSVATPISRFSVVDVPTYGIFAPAGATGVDAQLAGKAHEWSLPPALFLPGTDRVLLCADALDDFRAVLSNAGLRGNLSRLFLRGVLAHEHFHAFARTSPMDDGTPPPGPRFQTQWTDASPVNEALAAWIQLHLARDEPDLRARTLEYIESGSYPQWPYAGAAVVEKAYQDSGINEVRSLIHLLRTDPPQAGKWMRDKAVALRPPGSAPS